MFRQNNNSYMFSGVRYFGGTLIGNGAYAEVSQNRTGAFRNLYASDADVSLTSSIPEGTRIPVAWLMPQKPGGLSSINNIEGIGSISTDILAVKLAEASLTGEGELTAVGSLIVQLIADVIGSGDITAGDIQAFLLMEASLSGSGDAAGPLTGFAELISGISGLGDITATLVATGLLSADLTVTGTGLTTSNVGPAVWSALASANNDAGTMGEKLNDAGSGSNPWTEVIESGLSAAEILRIILAVQAGKSDITGTTVKFRDVADTKDRVTASMTGSERTTITLDGT